MELYGITKDLIKHLSVLDGDYYRFNLGNKILIKTTHKKNSNGILSKELSDQQLQDKFMIKYQPSNEIWFDKDLIDSDKELKYVSCCINSKSCRVIVGKPDKYEMVDGVLATSGILSANNLVQSHRRIYFAKNLSKRLVKNKVKVIAVGLKGEEFYGVFHIPRDRGLAISVDYTENTGLSTASEKHRDCWKWTGIKIDDWFDGNIVSEVSEV